MSEGIRHLPGSGPCLISQPHEGAARLGRLRRRRRRLIFWPAAQETVSDAGQQVADGHASSTQARFGQHGKAENARQIANVWLHNGRNGMRQGTDAVVKG